MYEGSFPRSSVPAEDSLPTQDTRRDEHTSLKIKWTSKLNLLSQTTAVNKNIYQQGTKLITTDITTQSIKDLLRNEA